MRELFEVAELVRVAVEDERTGVSFYQALAKKAAKADLRELFESLSQQEKYHQKRFEEMLAGLGTCQPKEQYPGEYVEYLRTMTQTRAFPDPETAIKKIQQCADDLSGIELAGRFERDTLILLGEMRGLVGPKDHDIVDAIMQEERGHLVALAEARRMV